MDIRNIIFVGLIFVINIILSIGVYIGIATIIKIHLKSIGELKDNPAYNVTIFDDGKPLSEFLNNRYEVMIKTNKMDKFVFVFLYGNLIFIICTIIDGIRNKKYHIIWLSVLSVLVNFTFPMIFVNLLYRMYYSWNVMFGIECFYIYEFIKDFEKCNKYKIDKIILVCLAFIILLETKETNNKIFDDWRVNEEAKNKYLLIGNTIKSYCSSPGKPVVYKYEGLNMNNTFDWSVNVFNDMGTVITQYINYNGFYIKNSGTRYEETLWQHPGDYENRHIINSYVSEGEFYIYVEINQE